MSSMRWVGLDVHARETVAVVLDPEMGELTKQRIAGRPEVVVEWLESIPKPFRAVYEAGPTGYGLYRRGGERGLDVVVCSPGHIIKNATDRIKTDERDATRLARLLLAGELRLVRVPEPAEEQLHDLVRSREDLAGGSDALPPPHLEVLVAPRDLLPASGKRMDRPPPRLVVGPSLH